MMKKMVFLVCLLGSVATFAQSKITGDWKSSRETPNGTFEITYTFKVEGDKLTGAIKTQRGENPIENGKVDGKKFTYTMSFNGNSIENSGELVSDDEIVIKTRRGDMKLTRVK